MRTAIFLSRTASSCLTYSSIGAPCPHGKMLAIDDRDWLPGFPEGWQQQHDASKISGSHGRVNHPQHLHLFFDELHNVVNLLPVGFDQLVLLGEDRVDE